MCWPLLLRLSDAGGAHTADSVSSSSLLLQQTPTAAAAAVTEVWNSNSRNSVVPFNSR